MSSPQQYKVADLLRVMQSDLDGSTRIVAGYEIVLDHLNELADVLRELHDFAEVMHRDRRSKLAFERAEKLLDRVGK